ncbi:hypothetical protein [Streptomyces sp. NPDC093568]|uniref:hypothetical protein n=1 Tax=Streptomyces sp. NPDC093568 TaxID=3366041 RepID=UPI00380A4B3E
MPTKIVEHKTRSSTHSETISKPWFLLEPDIGVRERVRRYMNYRLLSLKEQSLVVGNGQTTEAGVVRQRLRERTERILRAARHHRFSVKGKIADKVRPCYLGPHPVPSTTEMASDRRTC